MVEIENEEYTAADAQQSEMQQKCKEELTLSPSFPVFEGIRYRHSFLSKLILSEPSLKQSYSDIKNLLLSFVGVKSRISFGAESFKRGRVHLARLNVKGKSLSVELALSPEKYSAEKYHFLDNSARKQELPMLLRVRSARSLRYCLELIREQMRFLNFKENPSYQAADFAPPSESVESLVSRGLIRVLSEKGEAEAVVDALPCDLSVPSPSTPPSASSHEISSQNILVSEQLSEMCDASAFSIGDEGTDSADAASDQAEPLADTVELDSPLRADEAEAPDLQTSIGSLRDRYFIPAEENAPDEDGEDDLVVFTDENEQDEQFTVEIDLDEDALSAELLVDADAVTASFDPSLITDPAMSYYPPYYGMYIPPYGYGAYPSPAYGTYPTPAPYAPSVAYPTPPSASAQPMRYAPQSSDGSVPNAPQQAPRGTSAPSSAPASASSSPYLPPTQNAESDSDDPLAAALAALYSSVIAGEAALLQAQRCGFDEMFHESWLEED